MTKEGELMTQEEVRELLIKRVESEKQTYIARQIGVPKQVLSAYKLGKKELYPESLEKLEAYLTSN